MVRKTRALDSNVSDSKTFTLDGPYAFLDKLYSDIQDLSDAPSWNSSLRAHRAINCFLTLWHMTDWFWVALRRDEHAFENWKRDHPDVDDKHALNRWLCANSIAMRVAQQVATASKHVHIDRMDAGVVADIEYEAMGSAKMPIDVVIRLDGHNHSVENVVHEGHMFWQQLLNQALPEPPFI